MLSFLTFVLLIASLVYFYKVYRKYKKNHSSSSAIKEATVSESMEIQNVKPGGVLHLSNVGPEMEEYDVNVIGRHIYDQEGYQWVELEGEIGSKKVWIEIEDDDELEISIKLKDLSLREVGLSKSDLDRIDEAEEGRLTYDGEAFYYEDSDEAAFWKDGKRNQSEEFYFWDFENDEGDKYISVENWEGEYQVSLSVPLKKSQIEVYSLTASL